MPGRHLDGGPVVIGPSERNHNIGAPPRLVLAAAGDQHRHATGCFAEDRLQVGRQRPFCEQLGRRVGEHEIDLLLAREPNDVSAERLRRERRRTRGNSPGEQRLTLCLEQRARPGELLASRRKRRQDQLTRRPAGQRLAHRQELLEVSGVVGDDQDRALRRVRLPGLGLVAQLGSGRKCQCWVLPEHGALQLLQRPSGLDAELINEDPSRRLVRLERLRLTPGPVEREHELAPKPLTEWVLCGKFLQLTDRVEVAP